MIDQSLIALAFFKHNGYKEPNFQLFLEGRLAEDGRIFARYSRDTTEPVDDRQSSATYAFLLHYFEISYQWEYASMIRDLLMTMETYNPEDTHFFDFINKELALKGFLAL